MGELIQTGVIPEQETDQKKAFNLPLTSREVGIGSEVNGTHPVFWFHIRSGELHRLGNLLFTSHEPCPESNSCEISFEDARLGEHRISLDDIELENDFLKLGKEGEMVLREIKRDGLVMLYVSLSRDIPVI